MRCKSRSLIKRGIGTEAEISLIISLNELKLYLNGKMAVILGNNYTRRNKIYLSFRSFKIQTLLRICVLCVVGNTLGGLGYVVANACKVSNLGKVNVVKDCAVNVLGKRSILKAESCACLRNSSVCVKSNGINYERLIGVSGFVTVPPLSMYFCLKLTEYLEAVAVFTLSSEIYPSKCVYVVP